MNPSSTKIGWTITTLLALLACLITYFGNIKNIEEGTQIYLRIVFIIIFASILVFVFFNNVIVSFIQNGILLLKKLYTPFIYNSISVRIEYLKDDGSLASYERNDHMIKLSQKKNQNDLDISIELNGEIVKEQVSSINSTYSFPASGKIVFNCNFRKTNIHGKQYYSSYSFLTKNSFLNNEEFWLLGTSRYCNQYTVKIILPDTRTIKQAYLLKKEKALKKERTVFGELNDTTNNWTYVMEPKILISNRKSHKILSVRVTAVKPDWVYKLVWELS